MQRKELPKLPSAHELYKSVWEQKIYRLITTHDPDTLWRELESNQISECLKEKPRGKTFGSNYWEYYFTIINNHQKVHEILDKYKFSLFKESKFIPLEKIKYDYLGYTFSSTHVESPLRHLPLDYRAEAAYKLVLINLIDEAKLLENFDGLFGGRLILNYDIEVTKDGEWVSMLASEIAREFIPGDYYQADHEMYLRRSSCDPDLSYELTDFKFHFIELAIPYRHNKNYCLLEKDKALITQGVRTIFSQIQYHYLLELRKISSLENILPLARNILSQHPNSFFQKSIGTTDGFDPLTPNQRVYIDAQEQREMIPYRDENAAIYPLILNDIEAAIEMQPYEFCSTTYQSFTETQVKNFNIYNKIKLTWQEVGDYLLVRPVLCDIFEKKFIPSEIVYFPREISIKIQNRLLKIINDDSISYKLLINRIATSSNNYLVKIEKEGLVHLKKKYTSLLDTSHVSQHRLQPKPFI